MSANVSRVGQTSHGWSGSVKGQEKRKQGRTQVPPVALTDAGSRVDSWPRTPAAPREPGPCGMWGLPLLQLAQHTVRFEMNIKFKRQTSGGSGFPL